MVRYALYDTVIVEAIAEGRQPADLSTLAMISTSLCPQFRINTVQNHC